MPYIEDVNRRCDLARAVAVPANEGELAYALAVVCDDYIAHKERSYEMLTGVVAQLESVKHEIQRRFVDPYEDEKRAVNGEVFFNLTDFGR
jgi:hypothetical protein